MGRQVRRILLWVRWRYCHRRPSSLPPHRLSETERELESTRSQLRDHATRKKRLEDVCAQLDSPVPASGPEAAGTTADMEWRAQRLECLMYRWDGGAWVSTTTTTCSLAKALPPAYITSAITTSYR